MRVIVKEVLVQCIDRGMSERRLFKGEKNIRIRKNS